MRTREGILRSIKLLHTAVWSVMASFILAIPVFAQRGAWPLVAALSGAVLAECAVLLLNGMRCPLTDLAARYTDDRADNFDIYLPLWLARNNKLVFGWLFVLALAYSFLLWWRG